MFRALVIAIALAFAAQPAMAGFFDAVLCTDKWPDGEAAKVEGKAELQTPLSNAFPDKYYFKLTLHNGSNTLRVAKVVVSVEVEVNGEKSERKIERRVDAPPQSSFYLSQELGYEKIKLLNWKVDSVFGCEN